MDHTTKSNPNQSVLVMIPLDRLRMYSPLVIN